MHHLPRAKRREALRLHDHISFQEMMIALKRFQHALKEYDPDEPRVPAGEANGGEWTSEGGGEGDDTSPVSQEVQIAQVYIFEEPPLMIRPPLEEFPEDPTVSPSPEYIWKGRPGSQPGDGRGNYVKEGTKEYLRPDFDHPPPVPRHWDYRAPDGRTYRWLEDGTMQPKNSVTIGGETA